jgi:hypothetical protein
MGTIEGMRRAKGGEWESIKTPHSQVSNSLLL